MSYFRHFQEMLTSRDSHVIVNYIKHKSEIDNLYWKIVFEIWFIYQDFFQIKSILYICTCNTVGNRIIITRYRHIGNISHTYVIKRHVFIKYRITCTCTLPLQLVALKFCKCGSYENARIVILQCSAINK